LRLILNRVGSCRILGLAGLLFVCLPGLISAQSASGDMLPGNGGRIYTIHLSGFRPVAKIEVSVASAEWEVTAAYDPTGCEIHCSWRRKRDAFGRMPQASFLPLPVATVRIYTNFVALSPAVIVVDPAGLRLPDAAEDAPLTQEAVWLAAKRHFVAVLSRRDDSGAFNRPHAHLLSATNSPEVTTATSLPLRV
jgi:hypothetical protein